MRGLRPILLGGGRQKAAAGHARQFGLGVDAFQNALRKGNIDRTSRALGTSQGTIWNSVPSGRCISSSSHQRTMRARAWTISEASGRGSPSSSIHFTRPRRASCAAAKASSNVSPWVDSSKSANRTAHRRCRYPWLPSSQRLPLWPSDGRNAAT